MGIHSPPREGALLSKTCWPTVIYLCMSA